MIRALLPRKTNLLVAVHRPWLLAGIYWPYLSLLLLAATADAWTTLRNVRLYGAAIEVHLVQRLFFSLFGPWLGVPLAKLIQLGFVLLVAMWWRPWSRFVLLACALLYTLAAINNHFVFL